MRSKHLASVLVVLFFFGTSAFARAQSCSSAVTNNVGDEITVSAELSTTDPNENGEGEPLLVSSTGGELSGVISNYFVPTTFVYNATAANEVITGTNTGSDADESCTVSATVTKTHLLTPAQKTFFSSLAAVLGVPAAGFTTIAGLCTVGIVTGPLCGVPATIAGAVFTSGTALAALIAADPIDPNFMQIVTVVIPVIPTTGISSFDVVDQDFAKILGCEEALYTTLNRAAGASQAQNDFWLAQQLNEATTLEGQLALELPTLATDLGTMQAAIRSMSLDVSLTPTDVLQFETGILSSGIPTDILALLKSIDADPAFLAAARDLLFVQDVNAVAGPVSDLVSSTALTTLLNGFLVGPPTDKGQCMDGGWQAFNTPKSFKNQGRCIQFVNTGK